MRPDLDTTALSVLPPDLLENIRDIHFVNIKSDG